jgi:NADH-quinone oxidoreductase subunit C
MAEDTKETKPPAPAPAPKPAAAPAKPKGPAPVDASGKPLVANLSNAVPGAVVAATEFVGETTVEIAPGKLVEACRHLKEHESFTYLVDLTAVDWKQRKPRFDVVYWMHSFKRGNERIRLKTKVDDGEECPSVTSVWKAANWMEREVFDLFGIRFADHPDLRRILTWDGFHGHPLRKDFPIEGIDTGAAIYPDRYPEGGGPSANDPNRKTIA